MTNMIDLLYYDASSSENKGGERNKALSRPVKCGTAQPSDARDKRGQQAVGSIGMTRNYEIEP